VARGGSLQLLTERIFAAVRNVPKGAVAPASSRKRGGSTMAGSLFRSRESVKAAPAHRSASNAGVPSSVPRLRGGLGPSAEAAALLLFRAAEAPADADVTAATDEEQQRSRLLRSLLHCRSTSRPAG
jgi:hypothetical protein